MMAYLDWSKAEDERVEAQVAKEMGDNPLANARRGVREIWQRIERDSREQEALYSVADSTGSCIFVRTLSLRLGNLLFLCVGDSGCVAAAFTVGCGGRWPCGEKRARAPVYQSPWDLRDLKLRSLLLRR